MKHLIVVLLVLFTAAPVMAKYGDSRHSYQRRSRVRMSTPYYSGTVYQWSPRSYRGYCYPRQQRVYRSDYFHEMRNTNEYWRSYYDY